VKYLGAGTEDEDRARDAGVVPNATLVVLPRRSVPPLTATAQREAVG
jgi:hypothetical protein